MAARLGNGSRQPGRPVGRGSAQEVTPRSCIHASAGQRTSGMITAAVKARAEEQARHDKGARRSINRTSGHYPFTRETPRRRPGRRAQQPRTPRTSPGQHPEREPRRCTPLKYSKNMPLAGAGGWLVGLRSMSPDLTPSQSRESEVGKHYSPTHQPPKNKVKNKNKNKNKGQGQGQGQGQNHHRYRSSKRRGSDQAAVQAQQRAQVKPASGEDDSKTEQAKPARAKGTASRLRYSTGLRRNPGMRKRAAPYEAPPDPHAQLTLRRPDLSQQRPLRASGL